MDRRKALKNMGLSLGYIAATPMVMNILGSCTSKPGIDWTPIFFSKEEGIVIQNLIDLILPTTNGSPGAVEVNVPEFLDAFLNEVSNTEEQKSFKNGIQLILENLGSNTSDIKQKDYDALLAKFLKASEVEIEKFKSNTEINIIYETLTNLRSSSVWAFKNTQKIGMEILAYDPIPGEYYGCVSLEETTGGKAWSL